MTQSSNRTLLQFGDRQEDVLTESQAVEHFSIFGSSGSAKTTGSYFNILYATLAAGHSAVLATAKVGDGDRLAKLAIAAGRGRDVIRMTLKGRHCFDPMAYVAGHPEGTNIEDVISVPKLAMEVLQPNQKQGEQYWEGGKDATLRDLATPLMLARRTVSLAAMEELLLDGPQSIEQTTDEGWQKGTLFTTLETALKQKLSAVERVDLERCGKNWLDAWPRTPAKTRGVFEASVRSLSDLMLRGDIRSVVASGRMTFVPELLEHGAILIIDIPSLGGPTNIAAQSMILTAIMSRLEKREAKPGEQLQPIFVGIDEAQRLITSQTNKWLQVLRSARVSICLVSQDLQGYFDALGGGQDARTAVNSMLANCGTKIFHSVSDPETQDLASRLIGDERTFRTNFGGTFNGGGNDNMSAGGMEEERAIVEPAFFGNGLRRGGVENDYLADAVIFQNSRIWKATGKPFIKCTFRQRFF